jgi:hypothetical protein
MMFRITAKELTVLMALSITPEAGFEFETDRLDVRAARYRVLQVDQDQLQITRTDWLREPELSGDRDAGGRS